MKPNRLKAFTLALVIVGCFTPPKHMGSALVSVDRSATAEAHFGPAEAIQPDESKYRFGDSLVEAVFSVGFDRVEFEIANKSESSIRVAWDEAAFIGVDGTTSPVIHKGIRFMEMHSPKAPSVIPKGQLLRDFAVPTNNVSFVKSSYGAGSWNVRKLLPDTVPGSKFALMLPLDADGETHEYTFWFRVP